MDKQQDLFSSAVPDPKSMHVLEFDGSCEPNPGMMQIGFVIRDSDGDILTEESHPLGDGTNNIAEYQALLHGLRAALDRGIQYLRVQGDSMVVIAAVNERGKRIEKRDAHIQPLLREAWNLSLRFRHIEFHHVRREFNTHADQLSTRQWWDR